MPVVKASSVRGRIVHGLCHLPPGYELMLLPAGTILLGLDGSPIFPIDDGNPEPWRVKVWKQLKDKVRNIDCGKSI